jgi:hypothetical protein
VTVGDKTLLGSSDPAVTPPVGVGLLSPNNPAGSVASVGVASGGSLLNVQTGTANHPVTQPNGPADSLIGLNLGGHQVLGSGGNPALGLGVLSPNSATGTAGAVNLLSNGQPVAANVTSPTAQGSGVVQGVVGGVTQTVGGVLGGATGGQQGGASGGLVAGVGGTVGNVLGGAVGVGAGGTVNPPAGSTGGGLLGGLLGGKKP